jgi:hypothetical protein
MKMRSSTILNDQADKVISYTGSIISFFKNYTKRTFDLDKLGMKIVLLLFAGVIYHFLLLKDIVLLSNNDINDLIDFDTIYDHNGIIYLPENLLTRMNDQDQLTRAQIKSKIIFTLAKQLSRYWFNHYHFTDCHYQNYQNHYQNSNPFTTINRLFNNQFENLNSTFECLDEECFTNKLRNIYDENSILDYNIECFLRKGVIGWLSYMSLQLIQSDLFDLVSYFFI